MSEKTGVLQNQKPGKSKEKKSVLDPVDRVMELIFGLIMALTFTGMISVATDGPVGIQLILAGAIGCNIAWGIVDGFMYMISDLMGRSHSASKLKAVKAASNPEEAQNIIIEALPEHISSVMQQSDLEMLRERLNELPDPQKYERLGKQDFLAAFGVFLIVVISTFPVVLPFLFIEDAISALRISNLIAIIMLFFSGFYLGKHAGNRPLYMGIMMVIIGSILVAVTIALGG